MPSRSAIAWTEVTWNPTTGCDRVSLGCDNCYALRMAKRLKAMGQARYQADGDPLTSGVGFGLTCHSDLLDAPLHWSRPRLVFVNSMSDLFHPAVPDSFIIQVFATMSKASWHTFQVLTKRSARLKKLASKLSWPDNVWMGVTVESSQYKFRINHLRSVGANVRFLSMEPLLGPVSNLDLSGVNWVIAGGESGPNARKVDPVWVRDIRDQCQVSSVPFFFKQWGGATPKANGRLLDGFVHDKFPV